MATIKKACKGTIYPKSSSVSKRLGSPSKAKNGKSFPDLNRDGKVTKKDVLIGRGVLPKTAKKGMKVKKAALGTTTSETTKNPKDRLTWNKIKDNISKAASSENFKKTYKPLVDKVKAVRLTPKPKQKMGGKTSKKCKYGCK